MTEAERIKEAERSIRYAWYNTFVVSAAIACQFTWSAETRHARPLFIWLFLRPMLLDVGVTLFAGWIAYQFKSRVAAGYSTVRALAGAVYWFAHGGLLVGLFLSAIALLFGRGWHGAVIVHRVRRALAHPPISDPTIHAPGV